MKASNFHLHTLKEPPAEAEIVSHQLMLRGGLISKIAGGIYAYMPLGVLIIRKIEKIIREELNRAGAIELLMPILQPAELWIESGRWEAYGPELMRIKDRHNRDFILQPTSEELITELARQEIRSYRQLPKNFYHIQTKFRDERRPRFGVMRSREFTMKDAYSFDRDPVSALKSYQKMFDAYNRIFERMNLKFRSVEADTGSIGGSKSHEFQVIAATGEDTIVYCPESGFASNIELAPTESLLTDRAFPTQPIKKIHTPNIFQCKDIAQNLDIPLEKIVKTLVIVARNAKQLGELTKKDIPPNIISVPDGTDHSIWIFLVRADHDLNMTKIQKILGTTDLRFANAIEIIQNFECEPGYLGPVLKKNMLPIIADQTVAFMSDFVCGANEINQHFVGVNWLRDLPEPLLVFDIRNACEGDPSPDGKGSLKIERGIEVGHVFYLGTKYSEQMHAKFVDADGNLKSLEMGCYGIGVTRLLGAAIEQNHDKFGMIWPASLAPFEVVIVPLHYQKSAEIGSLSNSLYENLLKESIDAILDDRDDRLGSILADWDLIGVPIRITIGPKSASKGQLEIFIRETRQLFSVDISDAIPFIKKILVN